ncbi:C-type lectin domain family 1 member A [Suncus etruscus]|uniref:C-type lectin domain family 1 member A n=1 Tax=Suncus etruscus TaxID=109475 RepID=UPI00210FF1DA|nr:C-type lectin domain family 1 member A [Suncus etruscus]
MQAKYSSTRDMLNAEEDSSAISRTWRPLALTFLAFCLVLLIGLAALGLVFFQVYQRSNTQKDTISQKEEKLGNLSQQLQFLQDQNRKLTETLKRVAEKLCRELYNKTEEHRCIPCPDMWKWHGNKCYHFSKESKNWQCCDHFCTAANATMLTIHTQQELDFAMPQSYTEFFYSYWTGLSRNTSGKYWLWVDGSSYYPELFEIKIDFSSSRNRDCVTILNGKAFSKDCKELRRCACERKATTVKLEELL